MRHPRLPSTLVRRSIAALLTVAALIAALPARTDAQLLGGLLDKPLSTLASGPSRATTRVIVRTERGALAPVIGLLTALGGRVVAQHKLIDAVKSAAHGRVA